MVQSSIALAMGSVQNDEDAQKAKNILLEGFSNATKEDRNLNFNHLLFADLLVSFALFLFLE
ncbi:hypothetical protein, partial [Serratia marcescens]|uniref:hypothetical protein n=1 Tax=Serratia marcescens TaxID=615 RepID=UPI0019549FBD